MNLEAGDCANYLSPNETDVDLEFWFRNTTDHPAPTTAWLEPILSGTVFEDPRLARTWILHEPGWQPMSEVGSESLGPGSLDAVATESRTGGAFLAFAWPEMRLRRTEGPSGSFQIGPSWPPCPPQRRAYRRGKIYLVQESLAELGARIRREVQ